MRVILFLALKDILRDRKIVLLVIFLLAFSFINITFFPAFLNGLSNTFQDGIVDTGTSHIIITPTTESGNQYLSNVENTRKKIELIPGVIGTSERIDVSGTVFFEGRQFGARIEGIIPTDDAEVRTIYKNIVRGDYLSDDDDNEIILGETIAGQKIEDTIGQTGGFGAQIEGLGGVDPGERITIRFSNNIEREYRVKGIGGGQGFNFVSQSIYMTKDEAENVLGLNDQASAIMVRLNDKYEADNVKRFMLDLGIPSANIQTWEEASTFTEGINETFGVVILVTSFVGVVIVVSTVGIVIFINTSRKKRIIGVLKAIGMQQHQVMMVFLFESVLFGIIGTIIGVALVYSGIFFLQANPIVLPLGELKPVLYPETTINAILTIILSSLVAGYVPSKMAARQEILETIKTVE